ncbi:MAG: hypothetical protein B6D61_06495 [Bacteroidetes bacterium 4484_249]|nr:MAG: hypothetical protein B6D61_06495 [Bacteroidetes bacterium 4484_249]
MNKALPLFVLILLLTSNLYSQISIDQNDMPNVDDTLRYNVTYSTNGVDYTLTGTDYTWDFSGLSALFNQKADTFVHVWSTPAAYQLVFFYPFNSTIASPQPDFTLISGYEMTDVFDYYKETSSDFKEVGTAFKVNGVPLPFIYNDPDIIYRFPLQYSNIDSSTSTFAVNIPTLGYYGSIKKRKNIADGWGTLITPYGTFDVLRVKTIIQQRDSIFVDSLGIGFPINTNTIEYQWIGKGYGRPLLKVIESNFLTKVEYLNFPELQFKVDIGPDQEICLGESAGLKATVTGGFPPFTFFWDTFQFTDSINVSPNVTTNYSVTVMDSHFQTVSDEVTVFVNQPPVANAGSDDNIIVTTTVQLNGSATGGEPPYSYLWSPATGLDDPALPNPLAGPLVTTNYTLSVTDDNGCTGSDNMVLTVNQIPTFNVSGFVTDIQNGEGLEGVTITFSGMFPVITDDNGFYSKLVHEGWNGTAKPVLEDYSFDPDSIIYSNVQSNMLNQDYLATFIPPPVYFISGTITDELTGIGSYGVAIEFTGLETIYTDVSGFYSKEVTDGWTGTVTPTIQNFNPTYRSYTNVQADTTEQDFVRQQGGLPPGWDFTETGDWHIISIPSSSNPRVFGTPLATGDYIGLFYIDENNQEKCGGAVEWNGGNNLNITAYGDDANTTEKDGFYQLEDFIWKVYTWNNFKEYSAEADYFWLFNNDGKFHNFGFSSLTNLEVNSIPFDIMVMLEGPFNGANMDTGINSVLPTSQPFSGNPWNYSGTENVAFIPGTDIIDWILIDIRNTASADVATPATSMGMQAAFLRNDGQVVDLSGNPKLTFTYSNTLVINNLFVVIFPRNHIPVISATATSQMRSVFTYNFSNSENKALGGSDGHKDLGSGIWGMFSGNSNGDNIINDSDKDVNWMNEAGWSGYFSSDVNMDGQANNKDKNESWLPNRGQGSYIPE